MNLLIVDDEAVSIKGMMTGIDWKACGVDGNIWTAYSAENALRILSAQQVDILLCDIEMPGTNGIDVLRELRKKGSDVACIFLTCHASFAYAQEAIKLGCSDYILKPAPYSTIEERLKKLSDEILARKRDRELARYHIGEKTEETQNSDRSTDTVVKEVEEYIITHLADSELLVSDIAVHMLMNKDHLNRIFKKKHGISISQFLIQERMKLAAILLEKPSNNVNAVAGMVGYNNYPYFSSSFKQYHGMTPSQFRKEKCVE